MFSFGGDRCICGKVWTFGSKEEAKDRLAQMTREGFHYKGDPKRRPTGIVHCNKRVGIWHLTTMVHNGRHKLKVLEEELHREMAKISDKIVAYMEAEYAKDNSKYRFTSGEVADGVVKADPMVSKASAQAQVSKLRQDGTIVDLDEKSEPNGRRGGVRATYFALAKHLEEVTKPSNKVGEQTVSNSEAKKAEAKPATVPANPFDKLNSQMGELLTKVNGLATGYAQLVELAKAQRNVYSVENTTANETLQGVKVITDHVRNHRADDLSRHDELMNLIGSTYKGTIDKIEELAKEPITIDVDIIANVVNHRLGDLGREDSFIYAVRNEIYDRVDKTEELILNIKFPVDLEKKTDEEKYQEGIRAGIRLAAEMGLRLPDA